MSRLIDADLLVKNCKCTGKFEDNFNCVTLSDLRKIIEEQQTAFDVEKVIEQIRVLSGKADDDIAVCEADMCQYYDGYGDGLEKAIEIVKQGGRND